MLNHLQAVARVRQYLDELQNPSSVEDGAAKLLDLSETLWNLLTADAPVEQEDVTRFINIIRQSNNFALARLVIPILRNPTGDMVRNLHQQRILDELKDSRASCHESETATQSDFDDVLLREEKEVWQEAQIFRAGVLYDNHGSPSLQRRQQIQAWLNLGPGAPPAKERH